VSAEANAPVKAGQLQPTEEYNKMIELMQGIDSYRTKHPNLAGMELILSSSSHLSLGWTLLGSQNKLITSEDIRKRSDYIIFWSKLRGTKLLTLKCVECQVVPFGEKPEQQLSHHFALRAELGLWR
jgi:hypothetical protein